MPRGHATNTYFSAVAGVIIIMLNLSVALIVNKGLQGPTRTYWSSVGFTEAQKGYEGRTKIYWDSKDHFSLWYQKCSSFTKSLLELFGPLLGLCGPLTTHHSSKD